MMERKKRILFLSNYLSGKTGFAGFMREMLRYLYPLQKYELAFMGSGAPYQGHADFQRWPIKCYGTIPTHNPEIIQRMNQDGNFAREISYGMPMVDEAIKDFKPDIFVGCEDIWAFPGIESKKWVDKISTIVHTTLDSIPVLPRAYEIEKKIKHFYVWSEFAEKEMKKNGAVNVKTIHGAVNTKVYRRLLDSERLKLRQKVGLDKDTFCIGMLSRNQLRKAFLPVIEGFAEFKRQNPNIKTKLLFFTHYSEGFDLDFYRKYCGLAEDDVLCCYKCRATGEYFVLPYKGQDLDNPITKNPKSLITVNITDGLTDEQVNEWFNLLDCFIHPISSGALERSVSEAKLTEIPALINPYSCFEDQCGEKTGSIELNQSFYFEAGTNFKKSTVSAFEIGKVLKKTYEMGAEKRREIGKEGRQFVLDGYCIDVIGKKFEELFDSLPLTDWNFDFAETSNNPAAQIPSETDDAKWIHSLYQLILCREPDHEGFEYWKNVMAQAPDKETARKNIEAYFRDTATKNNQALPNTETPHQWMSKQGVDPEKAVLVCFQKSAGDLIMMLSLGKSLREQYPDKQLVISCEPQYRELIEGNPYFDLIIPWQEWFRNQLLLQGQGGGKPMVFKAILPFVGTQHLFDFVGPDNLNLDLKYA